MKGSQRNVQPRWTLTSQWYAGSCSTQKNRLELECLDPATASAVALASLPIFLSLGFLACERGVPISLPHKIMDIK